MQASMLALCWSDWGQLCDTAQLTLQTAADQYSPGYGLSAATQAWSWICNAAEPQQGLTVCFVCLFAVMLIWYAASVYNERHLFLKARVGFFFFFFKKSSVWRAAERPCDDVNSRKFADRLVFVCTDVTHVCVLPTFKLCLPSFGTSQGDTIGWITWISGTISK